MVKFKVSPSVKAAAVPTGAGFAGFAGMKRRCMAFEKTSTGVLRCAKFKKGGGSPVCDPRLVDGGRSPGLVRAGRCGGGGSYLVRSVRAGDPREAMMASRPALKGMRRRRKLRR